jgi:hypothetical protein
MKYIFRNDLRSDHLARLLFFATVAIALASVGKASTLTVTNIADNGPGTFRTLISSAGPGDTITFAADLSGQAISLTNGQITLTNNVTIDASSLAGAVAISGNNVSRVFEVATGAVLHLTALTIRDGYAPNAQNPTNGGGGILNRGTLTLTNCTLAANRAIQGFHPAGGAIENLTAATLTMQNCLIVSNQAGYYGGGIDAAGGVVTLNQCTLTANSSAQSGGGITLGFAVLTVNQCTVASNSASSSGGGMYQISSSQAITNSIVAGNLAPIKPNILGQDGVHSLTSGDPQLAPLGNYGGLTQTMPPLPGSAAINGCTAGTGFAADQRGYPRIVGPYADIGAVEGIYNPAGPGTLKNITVLGNGSISFNFTNYTDAVFAVLASTNLNEPLSYWTQIGFVTESPFGSGQFSFTDTQAQNYPQRFYLVANP